MHRGGKRLDSPRAAPLAFMTKGRARTLQTPRRFQPTRRTATHSLFASRLPSGSARGSLRSETSRPPSGVTGEMFSHDLGMWTRPAGQKRLLQKTELLPPGEAEGWPTPSASRSGPRLAFGCFAEGGRREQVRREGEGRRRDRPRGSL